MSTLFIYSPAIEHDWPQHPEHAGRGAAIYKLLEKEGVLADLKLLEPKPASAAQIKRVHHPLLMQQVEGVSLRGGGRLDADTYATAESFALAKLAVGCCCQAVDAIMTGAADNGFVVARPPGHHAEFARVGGFCLFNNVAAAARQAQKEHGAARVMIVDFDVHHGNGTQDIFYEDASVLLISSQLFMPGFYPGTGGLNEIGQNIGEGFTLNVPFPAGVGNRGYDQLFEQIIRPRAQQFQPDFIIISAGYDAHWSDPLAMAALGLSGYAALSQQLVQLAAELCSGRILFVLEGGYLLEALSHGVLNSIYALLGQDEFKDPLGEFPHDETDVTKLLSHIQQLHLIK